MLKSFWCKHTLDSPANCFLLSPLLPTGIWSWRMFCWTDMAISFWQTLACVKRGLMEKVEQGHSVEHLNTYLLRCSSKRNMTAPLTGGHLVWCFMRCSMARYMLFYAVMEMCLNVNSYDGPAHWYTVGNYVAARSVSIMFAFLFFFLQPPFFSESRFRMLENILHQPLILKPGISKAARDLLHRLLEKDPRKRLQNLVSKHQGGYRTIHCRWKEKSHWKYQGSRKGRKLWALPKILPLTIQCSHVLWCVTFAHG